jgi:NAD(P)-dependent dehydrogenase (short-subunit alcohol dehydrogenase family)
MDKQPDLGGLSALVTGATSGVGRTAARELGRHGAEVVVHGRDVARSGAVVDAITANGGEARFAPAHLSDQSQLNDLIEGGTRFAYRRTGISGRPPLVFFQHLMGTLDDHDPALSDAFATDREVILFNSAGVASSSGTVPGTIEAMARDAVTFTAELGLTTIDVVRTRPAHKSHGRRSMTRITDIHARPARHQRTGPR